MELSPLEAREVFHLEFLRGFTRAVKPLTFSLKGGSNLRLFFGSIRYSEDMDLDLVGVPIHEVSEKVLKILTAPALLDTLRTFGIERLEAPDLSRAKQMATVQRFKVHLFTAAGLDLFTKVEFSRQGLEEPFRPEPVAAPVLGRYRLSPLIVPHYLASAAIRQKVRALASRKQVEARDIFDLYTLSAQPEATDPELWSRIEVAQLTTAQERVFLVNYPEYRDKVVSFLGAEDQETHDSQAIWDEIRLRVEGLIAAGLKARQHGKEESGS